MAEEVKNETPDVAQTAPADAPKASDAPNGAAAPELNISDLNTVKSIIDIATTRGAFKANELEAVGKTYNKLNAFLEHVSKQAQANQEQQGEK
jgi:hypothetical protein